MPPVAIYPDELSTAELSRALGPRMEQLIVYAVVDLRASHDESLGHARWTRSSGARTPSALSRRSAAMIPS